MMAQISESEWKTLQLTTDYKGADYTASLTMGNPDFLSGTGMGVAHYLQNVTSNLALGTELAYQAAPQIPGMGKFSMDMTAHFLRSWFGLVWLTLEYNNQPELSMSKLIGTLKEGLGGVIADTLNKEQNRGKMTKMGPF